MKPRRDDPDAPTVYSTDPAAAPPPAAPREDGPQRGRGARVAKIRIEKAGRAGKAVTVVYGLAGSSEAHADLARDLKRACGAGGTVKRGKEGVEIEVQGDHRPRVAEALRRRGFAVKGA
ncbi:MAG: translation initiation factor [Planctomycetes bacterium]|nr:translation initiation factor [Planctomycetota bacterium]